MTFKVNDYVSYDDKTWLVFAISDSGLITLKNISKLKKFPASLVMTPENAKKIFPFLKIIKT